MMRSALAIRSRAPEQGGLPLLCLPGTACDERVFAPVLAGLDHRPVIFGDMTRFDTAAETARVLLAEAPDRFALVGFSLGGIVALEMAAQAPERIAGLALIGTNPRDCAREDALARKLSASIARRAGVESYVLNPWARLVAPLNRDDDGLKAIILDMARRAGTEVLSRQLEIAITRADARPRLSAIRVPTLVLSGEDEQITPVAASREILDHVSQAEMHVIPNAGHFAPLENPDAIVAHLRPWLDELNGAHGRRHAN